MEKKISTLVEFMKWAEQFNAGQYLFRGVSKESYEIEASAYRRVLVKRDRTPAMLLEVNKRLIEDARRFGHDLKNGQRLSDLELLAELQHYRAATCLIDFTYSAQVALWMACQKSSSETQENGKVVVLPSGGTADLRTINHDLSKEQISSFFTPDEKGKYPLYQWEPKHLNTRIIAQQSVFIFGGAKIETQAECIIRESCKKAILTSLEKSSGIKEARIYPDFDGFARLHVYNKPYEPDAQGYLLSGIEAQKGNKLDDAIDYFTAVISLEPDDPTLGNAYHRRGIAYNSKGEFTMAIEDFSKAIELNPENPEIYYSRALVYGRESDLVIEDFSKTIELNPENSEVYFHRGFTYFFEKDEVNLAVEDFTKLIELNPDNPEAYFHRGVFRLHLQDWEMAKTDLTTAINMGVDIIFELHDYYGEIVEIEEKIGVRLPEYIAAMLI